MKMNDNKKNVFIYAVIFFSCAFVILIVTGYSQIKFSNSVDEYKKILTYSQKEKNDFNINLSTALSQNSELINEIDSIKDEILNLKNGNQKLNNEISDLKKLNELNTAFYEKFLKATEYYSEGLLMDCSKILLEEIELENLNSNAINKYSTLLNKVREESAIQFYREGYNQYKQKNYGESIINMRLSLKLSENQYFSDDCYYFISYSQYRLKQNEAALDTINEILKKYPESNYIKELNNLQQLIDKTE